MRLVHGNMLLVQPVRDVVLHAQRVEQSGFLKHHADVRAQRVEVALTHRRNLLAEDANGAGVRPKQAIRKLQQHRLSTTRGPQQDQRLPALHREGDVLQHRLHVERDRHVLEFNDGNLVVGRVHRCGAGAGDGFAHRRAQLPKMPIMARVTSRSTIMMNTDDTTTACVVARPTPCVPPVVFIPK